MQSLRVKKDSFGDPLDSLNFAYMMEIWYPRYPFESHKIDGFVDEVKMANSEIKLGELREAYDDNIDAVEKYKEYLSGLGYGMNPYTQIRHCLYMHSRVLYEPLLFFWPA